MEQLIATYKIPSRFILNNEPIMVFMKKIYEDNPDISLEDMFEIVVDNGPSEEYTVRDFIFNYVQILREKLPTINPIKFFPLVEDFVEIIGGDEIWDILEYRTGNDFILQYTDWLSYLPIEAEKELKRLKTEKIEESLEMIEGIKIDGFNIRNYKYKFYPKVKNEFEFLDLINVDSRIIFVKALDKYKIYSYLDTKDIKFIETNTILSKDVMIIIKHKDDYYIIDGTLSLLSITIPENVKNVIMRILDENTINLNPKITKYSGDAITLNEEVNDICLLEAITNDDVVSRYLYVDETNKPYAAKRLLYFTHEFTKVRILLSVIKSNTKETLEFGGKTLTIDKGDKYIKYTIINASDMEKITQTLNDVTRIIKRVQNLTPTILTYYNYIVPGISMEVNVREGRKKKQTGLVDLKSKDVLFENVDYSRRCQAHAQPKIIDRDEINEWRDYQIMEFPKREDGVPRLYVCPNPKTPYPGLYKNKDPKTMDKYPYFPCCYEKDHMISKNSYYAEYFYGIKKQKISKEKIQYIPDIITDKILDPERRGTLPYNISEGLEFILGETPKRLGVPKDARSFFTAVVYALFPEYSKIKSDKERVKFVENKLSKVKDFKNAGKQELQNVAKIVVYDPFYFYHLAEVMFNINVFILTPEGLSVGNYSKFASIPSKREELKSIIVYRHFGTEADKMEYPQTELIITDTRTTFDKEVTEKLYNVLLNINGVVSTTIDSSHTLRLNYNSRVNFWKLIQNAESQIIDSFGRTQAILTNNLTIFIPPTQPWDFKRVDINDIKLTTYEIAIETMGRPYSTYVKDNKVEGLYYSIMDNMEGCYVPIIPIEYNEGLGIVSKKIPLFDYVNVSPIKKYEDLLRSLENLWIVMTYVFYLYSMQYQEFSLRDRVLTFVNEYVQVVKDKIPIFNDITIKSNLEQPLQNVLSDLSKEFPDAFVNNKFVVPDEVSKEKLALKLLHYSVTVEGLDIIPQYKLSVSKDFLRSKISKTNNVLLSDDEFTDWLNSFVDNRILKSLTINLVNIKHPLMYKDIEGHMFIIQNVYGGDINRAINVSQTWNEKKHNLGFNADIIDGDVLNDIIVFGISSTGELIVLENDSNLNVVNDDTILILKYTENRYSGLLLLN